MSWTRRLWHGDTFVVIHPKCDRDEEWLLGINVPGQMERFLNPLDFYRTHPSAEEPVESVCVGGAKLKM